MSRGPRTPLAVVRYIQDAAIELDGVKRTELAHSIQEQLRQKGLPSPEFETITKEISTTRAQERRRRSENLQGLDSPWSFGSTVKLQIPGKWAKLLTSIRIWCEAAGRTFTAREARWACELAEAGQLNENADPKELSEGYFWLWASRYSRREARAVGHPDTSDLDEQLFSPTIIGDFELATRREYIRNYDSQLRDEWTRPGYDLIASMEAWRFVYDRASSVVETDLHLGLVTWDIEIDKEMDRVYAVALRRASEDPMWENISAESRKRIAKDLLLGLIEDHREQIAVDDLEPNEG